MFADEDEEEVEMRTERSNSSHIERSEVDEELERDRMGLYGLRAVGGSSSDSVVAASIEDVADGKGGEAEELGYRCLKTSGDSDLRTLMEEEGLGIPDGITAEEQLEEDLLNALRDEGLDDGIGIPLESGKCHEESEMLDDGREEDLDDGGGVGENEVRAVRRDKVGDGGGECLVRSLVVEGRSSVVVVEV
ncbi:hypothetical protein HDV05_004801 [Chytridiales sp. JEL 0842]|nr:hypothetical protein HDV05_004801 [Chytridiales sp. JEL 0842]